jgi:hypothetical protein
VVDVERHALQRMNFDFANRVGFSDVAQVD